MIENLPVFAFEAVFQHHPLGMWVVELNSLEIVQANQAAVKAYGYAPEEWTALTLMDLCIIEENQLREAFSRHASFAGGKEYVFVRKDQSALIVDLSWQVFQEGKVLLTAREVVREGSQLLSPLERMTELSRMIRAEHGLEAIQTLTQEVQQRMGEALQAAQVGIWEWDQISGQVLWDEQTAFLMGMALEEFDGRIESFNLRVHPDDLEGVGQAILQAREQQNPFEKSFRVKAPEGQHRWVMSRGRFDYTPEGVAYRMTGVILDISARIQAETALRESEKRLRELMDAQKRFIADAAHELRTPLTAIQGNLDIFLRYPNIPEDEKMDILTEVQREASRLGRLVNDMLQLARGDAGAALREEEVQLDQVMTEMWKDISRVVPFHHLILTEVEPVQVVGDHDRLKQLVLILLENALKYTPEGGTVTGSLKRKGHHVELRIADTGYGISEEDLPRVFERFYRADRSRQRGEDPGGTGLGLPIAKWIVEGHKGKIWLESELGAGTVAVVQLPLEESRFS
ncbi:sensor histidine kinase [Deinococcus roseus]|nr:PAS domain-containing sensor histidine kinase [Deinococcus roseus]